LGLPGQIQLVRIFFSLQLLLWLELGADGRSPISVNKVGVCLAVRRICAAESLLTGRGGEGEGRGGALRAEISLLAGRGGEEEGCFGVLLLSLLRQLFSSSVSSAVRAKLRHLLLRGRGDKQGEEAAQWLGCSGDWRDPCVRRRRRMREAAFCLGVPKRRLLCAAAILGDRSHSELRCRRHLSIFFLQASVPMRRISLDLLLGFNTGTVPSGLVPGGEAGAQWRRSPVNRGEDDGLDCVLVLFSEVQFETCEDLFVISCSFVVLSVICTPL
jgi:hypothetical protein